MHRDRHQGAGVDAVALPFGDEHLPESDERRGRHPLGHPGIEGGGIRVGVESTRVTVAPMTEDEIAWYVASGEADDKAGAYGIQGLFSRFIPRIDGSYTNVVGLPVEVVYRMLLRGL